ncbi:hypothetical protein SSX86_021471 [Deinandra increscens subsp. villosa]|uniref:DUF4378 domain-containing protein n=1 Tax=Deinandra increscens subsp. villosa TaxID=3103831 RepID=A0AAP0GVW1_9ASTR
MPQESLRSVVYRSFVTCEDPRGVVEGKTIRISKTHPTKMKNSKEKEKMSLVEVKNGTQKLNETIDSWSKGVSFKSQQKDIAKDLLKGALDLQESLLVLGKLQEASCMPDFKKKQEKQSGDPISRIGSDRFESFRVNDSDHHKGAKLANGSSRDCFTELRDVIKEGLSKQNLLPPNRFYQQNAFASTGLDESAGSIASLQHFAGRKKMQFSPDGASTSSSRSSSMVYSTHEFTSSESFSSRATEEKSKRSNLIAKLMGLEEFPSKPPRKQLDVSSKTRPVFDVDLPNAKTPHSLVQKSDREHMSLDEIIIMMQSKGLLRSNKREIEQTSTRFMDDAPPIVLMKPQCLGPDDHKVKVYDNPIRRLHQEKAKTEDKSVKNRGKSKPPSNKQKTSVPVVTKPQKRQEIEKKIDKIQTMAPPITKKTVENAKSTDLISKNSTLKQVKAQRSVHQNPKLSSILSTNKLRNQTKGIKTEKPANEKLSPIVSSLKFQMEIRCQNSATGNVYDACALIFTQFNFLFCTENENLRHQSLYEAFENDSYHVRDVDTGMDQSETRNNQEESGANDVHEHKARFLKTTSVVQDCKPTNFVLFDDCVNEFLEYENQRKNPLIPRSILPLRACISEDHTMMEIKKRIENLRNYSKFSEESSYADTVSGLLERDLNLTTTGGAWGTAGWKDGCTVNEIEEAVLDLEKMVLSRLIDEILLDLLSMRRFA